MSEIDRIRRAIVGIVREVFPRIDYLGAYEYRVVATDGNVYDLTPVRKSTGMPDLAKVPSRTGWPGAKAMVELGSSVLVSFVDGDPSRPFVSWFDAMPEDGFTPASSSVDAAGVVNIQGGTMGAARVGDTIQAGPYAGTITSGSTKAVIG